MLFDFVTQEFKCTYCACTVEEDESAMPKKDSRLLLAKFNEQMERLYELLRIVEDIRLAPEVLEPDPVDIQSTTAGPGDKKSGPQSGDMNDGKWSGEASRAGGFRMDDQQVNITFGEEQQKEKVKKEVPTWISESTVADAAQDAVSAMGPSMGLVEDDSLDQAPDDEITSLLLRHEKTNKEKGGSGVVIPGDDSDSDNRSDDSDMEQDGDNVDRDAAILAAEFASNDFKQDDEDVGVMDDDSDGEDDIPTINVGGEEFDITDVTTEIIAKMTTEEMEKYNQLYQDFYKDMYD